MQVIASLRRRTKTGISVWHFCHDKELDRYFAVGGEKLEVKPCTSRAHMRQMYDNFRGYGYRKRLPSVGDKLRAINARKKQKLMGPIADPWTSTLPLDVQLELDALAA